MSDRIRSGIIAVLLLRTFCLAGIDNRSVESTSLFYGAAACAVNENIVSSVLNPAGLYHVLNTELVLNFDRSYMFNYVAAAHFFPGWGNFALACFNDVPGNRQMTMLAWGSRITGSVKGKYQNLLVAGLNAQVIFRSSDLFFSMNPGILYLLRSEHKGFRGLSIGCSTTGLFDHSSSVTWQAGLSLRFRIMGLRDLLLAGGMDFDASPAQMKTWACGFEMEILRPAYIGLGGGTGILSGALNLKWVNDLLYFSGTYEFATQAMKGTVTYRRIILDTPGRALPVKKKSVKQNVVRKKPATSGSERKPAPVVTEEMLKLQKDFLQEGLRHYTDNELYPAIEEWKKVIEISPDTEYGKQAAGYIEICEVELKGLKSK